MKSDLTPKAIEEMIEKVKVLQKKLPHLTGVHEIFSAFLQLSEENKNLREIIDQAPDNWWKGYDKLSCENKELKEENKLLKATANYKMISEQQKRIEKLNNDIQSLRPQNRRLQDAAVATAKENKELRLLCKQSHEEKPLTASEISQSQKFSRSILKELKIMEKERNEAREALLSLEPQECKCGAMKGQLHSNGCVFMALTP